MPKKKTHSELADKKFILLDDNGRLFGKYDLFIPLFIITIITLAFLIGKVLLQKDEYITAELFASGGEWWWDNPNPPYWLADPIVAGAIELDAQGSKLVEVLETRKFEVGERKMLWMKVRLKVSASKKSAQYRFRREPLQVGSVIYVAPNNVRINCNIMSIEGMEDNSEELYREVTLEAYDLYPWFTDKVKIGDKMLDNKGEILAEILDKSVKNNQMISTDYNGAVHVVSNPLKRDITLKLKMKVLRRDSLDYFSYFQPVKHGFFIMIPFETLNLEGYIKNIE